MILNLAGKFIFFAFLLSALQISQFVEHYHQFLSGYYEATKAQVDGYKATARRHEYTDINTMIADHLNNHNLSVRTDAQQKLGTLNEFEELTGGIILFKNGSTLGKAFYIISSGNWEALEKTLSNFSPGLPLTQSGWLFGLLVGFASYLVFFIPITLFKRKGI